MYRTHTCGELNIQNIKKKVTLSGWVQKLRNLGGVTFIDLRDRYGITQIAFYMDDNPKLCDKARKLGREFVIQVTGQVIERSSKNKNIETGEIEIKAEKLIVLNSSKIPPFTIENESDGGDELRMKYRYLDLRRNPLQQKIALRHKLSLEVRKYLDNLQFLEIETPFLIKSTPEGARDFLVPSRMNPSEFYALPQSPQTFKQLLMISGFDRYFQIVRCFRDEDLRADRQPEFTQIDCEMAFVEREDILNVFEGLMRHIFKTIKGIELPKFTRISYDHALEFYGSDKPDIRFDMKFIDITSLVQNKNFKVFNQSEIILAINIPNAANYTRKQIDEITEWVRRPQIGAKGLVWIKYNNDGSIKSSIDKFYSFDDLKDICEKSKTLQGDMLFVISGDKNHTRKALGELRLEMGQRLNLRDSNIFSPLWILDFPLVEFDADENRYFSTHHPFTSPSGIENLENNKSIVNIKANAYDMVINGIELGGGSIRIHNKKLQNKIFEILGFTKEEAKKQFGFLMNSFEYGAPPHGGIAFGLDRIAALLGGDYFIRDYIAFPKNNSGRDVMIDSPSTISNKQYKELYIKSTI